MASSSSSLGSPRSAGALDFQADQETVLIGEKGQKTGILQNPTVQKVLQNSTVETILGANKNIIEGVGQASRGPLYLFGNGVRLVGVATSKAGTYVDSKLKDKGVIDGDHTLSSRALPQFIQKTGEGLESLGKGIDELGKFVGLVVKYVVALPALATLEVGVLATTAVAFGTALVTKMLLVDFLYRFAFKKVLVEYIAVKGIGRATGLYNPEASGRRALANAKTTYQRMLTMYRLSKEEVPHAAQTLTRVGRVGDMTSDRRNTLLGEEFKKEVEERAKMLAGSYTNIQTHQDFIRAAAYQLAEEALTALPREEQARSEVLNVIDKLQEVREDLPQLQALTPQKARSILEQRVPAKIAAAIREYGAGVVVTEEQRQALINHYQDGIDLVIRDITANLERRHGDYAEAFFPPTHMQVVLGDAFATGGDGTDSPTSTSTGTGTSSGEFSYDASTVDGGPPIYANSSVDPLAGQRVSNPTLRGMTMHRARARQSSESIARGARARTAEGSRSGAAAARRAATLAGAAGADDEEYSDAV